jgi:hypothetical protein
MKVARCVKRIEKNKEDLSGKIGRENFEAVTYRSVTRTPQPRIYSRNNSPTFNISTRFESGLVEKYKSK